MAKLNVHLVDGKMVDLPKNSALGYHARSARKLNDVQDKLLPTEGACQGVTGQRLLRRRPSSLSKTPHGKLSLGQIRKQPMIQGLEPPPPLHPKLRNFEKYISEGWYDSDEITPDPVTATQADMNNRDICFLHRYLEDEISTNILHRRVCQDF
ncbi:hypothetical protein E4U14_000678, partial [Claviceps sp. LM454 group G7]